MNPDSGKRVETPAVIAEFLEHKNGALVFCLNFYYPDSHTDLLTELKDTQQGEVLDTAPSQQEISPWADYAGGPAFEARLKRRVLHAQAFRAWGFSLVAWRRGRGWGLAFLL